jgi:hypothetical protein
VLIWILTRKIPYLIAPIPGIDPSSLIIQPIAQLLVNWVILAAEIKVIILCNYI